MNDDPNWDDQTRAMLQDGVPAAPDPEGWADTARRKSIAGRVWLGVACLALVGALTTAAGLTFGRPDTARPADQSATPAPSVPQSSPPITGSPTGMLTGVVLLLQTADQTAPMLCTGVLDSYPPQCSGPTLVGDFDWSQIPHETANGVRWSKGSHRVIGTLDLTKGKYGTFTLTRPISSTATTSDPGPQPDLSPVCTDPLRGRDATKTSQNAALARDALIEKLPAISIWIADDASKSFNVLVKGDAEQTRAQLREVWGGPLCVASGQGTTMADRVKAVERVIALMPLIGLEGAAPGGQGRDDALQISLTMPNPNLEATVREAAGAGITIRFHYTYTPWTNR